MRKKIKVKKKRFAKSPKSKIDRKAWRKKFQADKLIKFNDLQKHTFLEIYSMTGRHYHACAAVSHSPTTIKKALEEDEAFAEAYEEAKGAYADNIKEQAYKLAVDGVDKPLIGGKFRDEIVAHEKVYATNILLAEMKRTDKAGYSDRHQVDLNVKAGVLVVPGGMSMEEWEKLHGQ